MHCNQDLKNTSKFYRGIFFSEETGRKISDQRKLDQKAGLKPVFTVSFYE